MPRPELQPLGPVLGQEVRPCALGPRDQIFQPDHWICLRKAIAHELHIWQLAVAVIVCCCGCCYGLLLRLLLLLVVTVAVTAMFTYPLFHCVIVALFHYFIIS